MDSLLNIAKSAGDEFKFILMNKNTEVLTFKYVYEDGDYYFEEIEVLGLLPLCYTDVDSWIRSRRSPISRKRLRNINKNVTMLEYIKVVHAVSLNDTYWIKELGSDLTWSDVSPYSNMITDLVSEEVIGSVSPELSTNGVYPKCWMNIDNGIYLIKGGSKDCNYIEPILEVYASIVYNTICSDSVEYQRHYGFSMHTDKCKLFTSENLGMVSIASYLNKNTATIKEIRECMSKIGGEHSVKLFNEMLVADAVVMNTDRHLGNIGLYIENDTQKLLGMAPVFDYNRALLPELTQDIYTDEKRYNDFLRNQIPRLGTSFFDVAKALLNKDISEKLTRLKDIVINTDTGTGRISICNGLIIRNIDKILN